MSKQPPRDKELTIQDKIKQLLRLNKNVPQTPAEYSKYRPEDFILTAEVVKEIGSDAPASQRIKTLKRLTEDISGKRMAANSTETIWINIRDLLHSQQPRANRQAAFAFVKFLIHTQYDWLDIMRAEFFNLILHHDVPEDLAERIELLKVLSKGGREIEHFEDEIGQYLLQSTAAALSSTSALEFLQILLNLIKFHSAYLESDVVKTIVWLTCHYTCHTTLNDGVVLCLQVLEAVICYSCLPPDSMECIITTLCRTVNVEKFSQLSWKLIRNLLGTHLGHSALYAMCDLLQKSENQSEFPLLRGAVFFIGMCLWGSQKVVSLKCTHSAVLPCFLRALNYGNTTVAYEVSLSIERLVRKYGKELPPGTWDLILDLIEALIAHTQTQSTAASAMLASNVHEILSTVEQFQSQKEYNGCEARFFSIIEKCAAKRPESSVLRLVNYLALSVSPHKLNWLISLKHLLDYYYKQETRTSIRLRVLEILNGAVNLSHGIYEDDIIEKILLPSLMHIENDQDLPVRNAAVQLLVNVAGDCGTKSCLEILEILSKVICRPYDQSNFPGGKLEAQEIVHVITESEIVDVKTAVFGLIDLFKKKVYLLPSTIAVNVFRILSRYIDMHYNSLYVAKDASILRTSIFQCFLSLRANERHQLGVAGVVSSTTKVQFSSYLLCSHGDKNLYGNISPPTSSPTPFTYPYSMPSYMSLGPLFQAITVCLKQEKDWSVLEHVLLQLPKLLQNKSLLLSTVGSVGLLCESVCALLGDRTLKLPETLRNAPVTLSRSEFHLHVYPIHVALVSYNKYLDNNMQRLLVTCLRHGLNSKCARACIVALTVCILEMTETMYKLLPEVLLGLSKISATVAIATPILEFLSTLIRLPRLYTSFVQDQYMSIFAILLPYTNPLKFNHYTISLTHHVIAMWFIKCRLPFRRDFVRFIVKGLRNNVQVPFDEGTLHSEVRVILQEVKDQEHSATPARRTEIPEAMVTFHKELTETCIDLLTRYAFACCSVLPKRSPLADFLLAGGQSMTWLLGNSIITVTTSGCNSRASKCGLCDKCFASCKGGQLSSGSSSTEEPAVPDSDSKAAEVGLTRRRHRSAAVHRSLSIDSQEHVPRSKDDMQLRLRSRERGSFDGERHRGVDDDLPSKLAAPSSDPHLCSCWCQGWAEILIRRPTGNSSWIMRIQNLLHPAGSVDFPLSEISKLLLSSHLSEEAKEPMPVNKFGHARIDSESLEEGEVDSVVQQPLASELAAVPRTSEEPAGGGGAALDSSKPEKGAEIQEKHGVKKDRRDAAEDLSRQYEVQQKRPLRKTSSSPDVRTEFQSRESPYDSKIKAYKGALSKTKLSSSTENVQLHLKQEMGSVPEEPKGLPRATPVQVEPEGKSLIPVKRPLKAAAPEQGASGPATSSTSFEPVPAYEPKAAGLEEGRRRRGSGIEKKPPRLPDIGERRAISPMQKPTSAPLSPLPLTQAVFEPSDLPPMRRDRGHTISVMSPVRHTWLPGPLAAQQRTQEAQQQGISPSFVFLQLFHSFRFGVLTEKPILLPKSESVERAVKLLDHIPPYDTHKIGVVYVGQGQAESEAAILSNEFGSMRYVSFLHGLGRLVRLKDVNPRELYVGGLDLAGPDGNFTYVWQDDVMQVIFHVATLMPNKQHDPSCNGKKLHIGNDFVSIVYNDSGCDYNISTIKGQFIYACVVIEPLDQDSNLVTMKVKPEFSDFLGNSDPKIVSDGSLATLVRQLALHANLASKILQSQQRSAVDLHASNWLERLRHIRRLRDKRLAEAPPPSEDDSPGPDSGWTRQMDDFTGFV